MDEQFQIHAKSPENGFSSQKGLLLLYMRVMIIFSNSFSVTEKTRRQG
jgi:hypothetical protein